ncbi:MAG: adenosylcobinamide amidohydrolase [Proteobacteria bacterium]|nr:adenosylcobinamide amidohydrolase [Pseudomonadota bacterium]
MKAPIRGVMQRLHPVFFMLFLLLPQISLAKEFPVSFIDDGGQTILLNKTPDRVVSLVPSVTEMLLRLGAGDAVVGITHHSVLPPETAGKEIVGGFANPDLDLVAALQPDVIFYADLQKDVPDRFRDKVVLIQLAPRSIQESFAHIRLLGRIFNREAKAAEIIAEEERQLAMIARKIAGIPPGQRQRVMRLMGRDTVMAPGDDSFQNEYIRAAGGIAPVFGKNGNIIQVSLAEWRKFNPQVLYGCGDDKQVLSFLHQPGWKEVDAVRNNRVLFFPCDLTCRVATHPGYFVSWLAASVYGKEFSDPINFVQPDQVVSRTPLQLDLDYVAKAEIIESDIKDFRNKTVAVTFKKTMAVISTLEGQRDKISTVANHYFPPPSWGLGHQQGLTTLRESTLKALGFAPESTAMLFTGANMDNLAVVKKSFKAMEVTALVTAGVESNAMRMSADTGLFYEPDSSGKTHKPGTINILLLTNMRLSPQAMSRGIISATEAKSAALQDLDIRSSYSAGLHQATGTGTDNIIVVEGAGLPIDASGGHTKMGELMASAVYEGVQRAIYLQNGLVKCRSIFQRLKERQVNLHELCLSYAGQEKNQEFCKEVETILLQPEYADFLKAVMAISDDYERGLVVDLSSMDLWFRSVAERIAGSELQNPVRKVDGLPTVMAKGIGAVFAGVREKIRNK